ncbi:MAG: D-tyrosyl-tRNA(Tyr) deacylase [Thalassobium sp.]|nr:MAG: D-tyrosyl-tRNA(Tyr) deacylase [Thalassobium sp.]
MIGLIQRVSSASVVVDGETTGAIGAGILLLLGVQREDTAAQADKLLNKVLNYRIFADDEGRMNRSLLDGGHELLVVSQFTLAADTGKGTRPGFSRAAAPDLADELYRYFLQQAAQQVTTASGRFGADMKVSLTNDGPVTFWLEV